MAQNGIFVNAQPYEKAQVITKSDATVYTPPLDGLYVGGTGHVNIVTAAGQTVLISAIPAGAFIPIKCKQVLDASTTATLILGLNW